MNYVLPRVGSPNRTKPNRTEPYRTLGEPNRDHVRFLANTNRDEQSLPMFGSFGCSVRQNTNRTEQMCLMFVFGSCSIRLVRYNVVPPVIDLGGPYPCLCLNFGPCARHRHTQARPSGLIVWCHCALGGPCAYPSSSCACCARGTTLCVYFWFSDCPMEIDYLYHQNSCKFRGLSAFYTMR